MAKKNELIVTDVDTSKVTNLRKQVFEGSHHVEEIVDHLVKHFCEELDNYMTHIKSILTAEDPATPEQLDDFILNLPVLIYFTSEAQETLGIREDVAKAIRAEQYNSIFGTLEGTIADKEAAAQLETQCEMIVQVAYSRAYKKVKERITAAYEMISSVKKVVSRRIQETELARFDSGRVKVSD
jgi:hypothetical protein